jgi:hypothetical protein
MGDEFLLSFLPLTRDATIGDREPAAPSFAPRRSAVLPSRTTIAGRPAGQRVGSETTATGAVLERIAKKLPVGSRPGE